VTDTLRKGDKGPGVHKYSPDGRHLLALTVGSGAVLTAPSAIAVSPGGRIYISDGHGPHGANRIVEFTRSGHYIGGWGRAGQSRGEFRDPHALAFDSRGRLFVGDRGNSRIQLFSANRTLMAEWRQFGRPSGLYIDLHDRLYATDSESGVDLGPGSNPQGQRGVYIGSAKSGAVFGFLPDPSTAPDAPTPRTTSAGEGVAVDVNGNIYAAEVGGHMIRKYERIRPSTSERGR
jgi:streptogramin lyase